MSKNPLVIFLVFIWMFLTVSVVSAITIPVSSTTPYVAADGLCSLVEAIDNANADAAVHADCPAGAGADEIILAGTVLLDGSTVFPASNPVFFDSGDTGLPEITSDITISGGTIQRIGSVNFRFFVVQSGASLTLNNISLINGSIVGDCAFAAGGDFSGCGAAIVVNNGNLTISNAVFSANQANQGVASDNPKGGAIMQFSGTVTINESTFNNNSATLGGAISIQNGTHTLIDTIFSNNTSIESGGAIYNSLFGNLTVIGSTFTSNSVTTAPTNFNGGGAIDNAGSNSQLTVSNTDFTGNSAANGGAINNFNASDAFISNSRFTGNSATVGGAILTHGSGATLNLYSSTVNNNTATDGAGIANGTPGTGTGITNIFDSLISNNVATDDGGGISTIGTLTVENSIIDNNRGIEGAGIFVGSLTNQAVNISGTNIINNIASRDGGGLYYTENPSSAAVNTLTVTNSTFDNNQGDEGGGIYTNVTDVTIDGSTFSNNSSSGFGGNGGGIHIRSFVVTGSVFNMTNSTVSGNSASASGGGLYFNGSTITATINSSTIANNVANSSNAGDGIHNLALPADVTVRDSIVANNSNRNCIELAPFGVTDGGNNISSDSSCGFADTGGGVGDSVNPLLAILADNGGFTRTLALQAGSPAINNGSGACPANDQRGTVRLSVCDVGAYESSLAPLAQISVTLDEPILYEVGGPLIATITITIDNSALNAQAVNVLIPLQITGNASGLGTDYTLSNQNGSGQVPPLSVAVAAGAIEVRTFTVTVVDDTFVEASELVNISASVLGYATFVGANAVSVTIVSDDIAPVAPFVVAPTVEAQPAIDVFDPAISKIGFLVPGQVGVTGETLEWIVTVSNTGNVVGSNIIVTDTLVDALRIDRVDAPNANVNIIGQFVSVMYPSLAVGENVQFSIFTTVLDGVSVENTACVNADNQAEEECVTGIAVAQLPNTGETLPYRNGLIAILGLSALMLLLHVDSRKRRS